MQNGNPLLATTRRVPLSRKSKIASKYPTKKGNATISQSGTLNTLPKRPGNVNHWGREGEKYQPGMMTNNNANLQQTSDPQGKFTDDLCRLYIKGLQRHTLYNAHIC